MEDLDIMPIEANAINAASGDIREAGDGDAGEARGSEANAE